MQRPGRHPMQVYLETANPDEVSEAMAWRVVDGVFTDPALLAREGKEAFELIHELIQLVPGPVAVEVTAAGTEEIIEEARALAAFHERVLVRVPCVPAAIPAIAALLSIFLKLKNFLADRLKKQLILSYPGKMERYKQTQRYTPTEIKMLSKS